MKVMKVLVVIATSLALLSVGACAGKGKAPIGKGKAPPPIVTKG